MQAQLSKRLALATSQDDLSILHNIHTPSQKFAEICMYFRNFEILHEFHESIFRHASRERARLSAVLRLYGGLYGGPEWPVFARVPLAAQ
jgi:hypothetical protein